MKELQQFNLKMPPFQTLVRYERLAGVDYQIYPCVMLVEGVHQGVGSDPVYYPPDVLSESAPSWNNLPVTIGHPVNLQDDHVLCNEDGTIRSQWQIGYVANARHEDGKLKADLYINVRRAKDKAPQLLPYLQAGGELQVSTGMLAGLDGKAGAWNGEDYIGAVNAIIPDHLALLPNGNGACSWDDGCGVRVNAQLVRDDPDYVSRISTTTTSSGYLTLDSQLLKEDDKMAEVTEKCCPERVLALITNEKSPFGDGDTEWLEALNEDTLGRIESLLPKDEPKPEPTFEPVTLESYLENAPAEIRAVLNEGLRAYDDKRKAIMDRIMNHEGNAFSEEQLKGMDTEMLQGIASLVPEKKSYVGANPNNKVVVNEEVDEEPYVPVTLSDAFGKK
jgi:hypothetical protein